MPSWLCKIWRFIANILGKIVDFVLEVLSKIIDFVVEAIDSVFSGSGFSNLLLFAGIGLAAYFLLKSRKDKSDITIEKGGV